jgi:hypothetical protein
MKLYKLTDENAGTRGNTLWGPGVTHTAKRSPRQELCTDGWIHAYRSPLLAELLNPIGANFINPRLWEAKGVVGKEEWELKVGCRKLTTIREIPLPIFTMTQKVAFAILAACNVKQPPEYVRWAQNWLDDKDRSTHAAAAAANTHADAAAINTNANAAAAAAANAYAAAQAAYSAAYTAAANYATYAAYAAADAARAAGSAAYAADYAAAARAAGSAAYSAAYTAAYTNTKPKRFLSHCARKCLTYK